MSVRLLVVVACCVLSFVLVYALFKEQALVCVVLVCGYLSLLCCYVASADFC